MDTLKIVHQVPVKSKVTESLKTNMVAKMQETIKKLDLELQNIEFQTKRTVIELEKQNPPGITAAKKHFETERNKRLKAKEQLTQQIKQVGKLPLGSEIVQGNLDVIAELKVGDNWQEVLGVEVVVCDDRIVEIRRRTSTDGK